MVILSADGCVATPAAEVLGEVDVGDVDIGCVESEADKYYFTSDVMVPGGDGRGLMGVSTVLNSGSAVTGPSKGTIHKLDDSCPDEQRVFSYRGEPKIVKMADG